MRQIVILAGGRGTRLRSRLGDLPKPLVDVGGIPLLERQLVLARSYDVSHAVLLVSYGAGQIREFCASRRNFGLHLELVEDGEPRGTAGATLAAFDHLADEMIILYGDAMLDVDLSRFLAAHAAEPEAAATLFLHPNDHPQDSDLVELDDAGLIKTFHPYPHDPQRFYPNLVNAALYVARKDALAPWRTARAPLDFGKDLFPAMLARGSRLKGYVSAEYIKDLGTPSRLDRVCADLRSGAIERARRDRPQRIVFLDRDGTLNREIGHLTRAEQIELLPRVPEAIRRLNQAGYRCCVVTNQPVVARGDCSFEELHRIHNKLETLLGREGAYLDRIYYCPHHPHRGFAGEIAHLKTECDCRKPRTGMIERALSDLGGARATSFFVGDTSVDIETARRAGLRSVLVRTGHGGLDGKLDAEPGVIVEDLYAAVDHILAADQCAALDSEKMRVSP